MSKKNHEEGAASPRKGKGYWKILAALAGLSAVLNLLACFRGFCDWYKRTVYGVISDGLGMATGWFPVALGEILAYIGVLFVAMGPIVVLLLIFLRKKPGYRRFAAHYGKSLLMTVMVLLFIYTVNWIIPFRGTILKVNGAAERKYTVQEVENVRNHIVNQINQAAQEVPRDEKGRVIYDHEAIIKGVYASMEALADEYPLLSGYYPPMKDAIYSDVLRWMDIGGYTYPYTMEITWNKYVNNLYFPFLLAHESSHHQGYYQENEANFIAFLACTRSDDPVLRYAGYKGVYNFIQGDYINAVYEALGKDLNAFKEYMENQPKLIAQVAKDQQDAWDESDQKYEADSHPAQSLEETSAKVADVGWSTQTELLQENGYGGVVKMLLEYYDVKEGGLDTPF